MNHNIADISSVVPVYHLRFVVGGAGGGELDRWSLGTT